MVLMLEIWIKMHYENRSFINYTLKKGYHRAFSASINALTPSIMSYTKSLSDLPSLLLFEISNTPSFVSVCSPWIPLI